MSNQNGFTLIETIFVLCIFSLIVSFSFLLVRPQMFFLDKHLFFSQFKDDLFYMQQYAISNQTVVSVNILPLSHRYYAKDQNGKFIVDRTYSNKVNIREGSQKLYFRYNTTGNINTFGTLYIDILDETYRFTFYIGKGRFYAVQI
ncbi:competence type IV pilus minor pilin ComGD [Robertmurraya korlensis]|uniref:competence type IV pilus minor pilin ComGD n=1 Tax=Robertmurraya korlensis TaxID=519977 RepID=UPI000824C7EB|nr:competence type IV pilus minor pilin ComGD [Robertmurraya korlensis]